MLVARCQGHNSWVSAVAFDPWRCDERNYRIGSVGEDCRLLLWDFSVGMLHRPRAVCPLFRCRCLTIESANRLDAGIGETPQQRGLNNSENAAEPD